MKKLLIILNDYLLNFWATIILLTLGGFSLFSFGSLPKIIEMGQNGSLSSLLFFLGNTLTLFFLPLATISIIIFLIIWLKGEPTNSRRGLIALIIVIISLALISFLIIKLSILDVDIKNGTLFIPTVGGPERLMKI